jgi:hypothetical protein
MIKDFNELHYKQKIKVSGGDKRSIYYGHIAEFVAMSTFFGEDVAVVNFIEPKPIHWIDGKIVESDVLFLHEIAIA